MKLALEICQALANSGMLAAAPCASLIWCEVGWFVVGELSEQEAAFRDCLLGRGYRVAEVARTLEALAQATLWQIGQLGTRTFGSVKARPRLRLVQ